LTIRLFEEYNRGIKGVFMDKKISIFLTFIVALSVGFYAYSQEGGETMQITSNEFEHNGFIPRKFTCQGRDISPPLTIDNIPQGTRTFALIVDDPDAPMGTWVHWVVFNISPAKEILEGTIPGTQGINDFGKRNYGGPCPPSGTHRYFFKLYALDSELKVPEGLTKEELERAMEDHILAQAELIGLYKKE